MRIERFGELAARVVGGDDGSGAGQGPAVVLLHGYGAPGDDLVGLASELAAAGNVRFVFPEAPIALPDDWGRAWWPLDVARLPRGSAGADLDDELPAQLPEARAQLLELLDAVATRLSVAPRRMVIGGFSQGAMLACDVALHSPLPPAALVLLSGAPIARSVWQERLPRLRGVPVLQTHGRDDPLLAHDSAERLRDRLRAAGADVQFVSFPGGHGLPQVACSALSAFLRAHAV